MATICTILTIPAINRPLAIAFKKSRDPCFDIKKHIKNYHPKFKRKHFQERYFMTPGPDVFQQDSV